MPSTRRRFLAGVTAVSAALAGCNEGASGTIEGTVTPVDVPRTDEEIMMEVASIEAPSISSPVVVGDAHHAAAVEHVETLRDSIAERLEAPGEFDHEERTYVRRPPEAILDHAEDQLEIAREAGPSLDALRTLRRTVDDLARADGALRAETGEIDVESLRAAVEAEREAATAVGNGVEYRIARPVAGHLPTAARAERTLDGLGEFREAEGVLDETDDEDPHPGQLAPVYRGIEHHRRRREDAELFLETSTDPDAPSLRTPIEGELDAVEADLAAIADRYSNLEERTPGGEIANGDVRAIRRSVGERTLRFRSGFSQYREDGRRLYGLFEGVLRVIGFESIDAAVERTVPLARQREFPAARLPEEKRRAVEAVERAADGSPVQRQFAETAPQVLGSADRFSHSDAVDSGEMSRAFVLYAAAVEWAERGLSRGEAISSSLQAQQS